VTDTLQTLIGKQVQVLDKGFIELQDLMPHPNTAVSGDLAIVSAARTSFMGEGKGDEKDKKLLFYLMRNAHTSPFEMVEFKFRFKAPLVTWWQMVRHRMTSMNLQSGRYVEFEEDEFYIPSVWRKQSASNKQASDGVIETSDDTELTQDLIAHYARCHELYRKALSKGVAREMARLYLPGFAVYYTGIWKQDAHNLMHFLKLRMAPDAQEEIRVYAQAIYTHFFKPALPWTAEAFEKYVLNKAEGQ
jgi:thymidylate synthase (FAD)